uniref:DUF4236 domain-containing protein n=1 Tax=Pedobacter sp. FW305-3-2-15-E-R2A2 TaxID=3140251 RepID=UPI00406BEF50
MTWSFHKRIKIIPVVHLNLSKGGMSTAVGIKRASMPQPQIYNQDRLATVSGLSVYRRIWACIQRLSGKNYTIEIA